jgi:hypothetical protein
VLLTILLQVVRNKQGLLKKINHHCAAVDSKDNLMPESAKSNHLWLREALDNPGVDPRLTSKSLAASRMLRALVEVFQSFLGVIAATIEASIVMWGWSRNEQC